MWTLFRYLSLGAFLFAIHKAMQETPSNQAGDLTPAFYMALTVLLAIVAGIFWASYLGEKLSGPMTGMLTKGHYTEPKFRGLRLIRRLEHRGFRRLTLLACFLEGIRRPSSPTHFVIGLENAKPGSWLEKVFALEVFQFDNARNCLLAHEALQRHGIDARPHRNPEINLVLLSLEKSVHPTPQILPVPKAPPPATVKRNSRICLFQSAEPDPPQSAESAPGANPEAKRACEGKP